MTKIFVAGHNGMVGSALCRQLETRPNVTIITRGRAELDLCDQSSVQKFMRSERPDEVIIAAAKVGGVHANNTYPAEFIYQNLQIQNNLIQYSHLNDVQKLLFLGSSCIYPKLAFQPMAEDALLTGTLEPSNEPYAIAKIAGIKMCESFNRQYGRDYRSVMPTNLYGPGDNYDLENSHVIPALIRRFHEAKMNKSKEVIIWGTGSQLREFLYVDDMAAASLFIHDLSKEIYQKQTSPRNSHLNIGTGYDLTIRQLAENIKNVVGFSGEIIFDTQKPEGVRKKLLNSDKLRKLGWEPSVELNNGLRLTYDSFLRDLQ